MIIIDILLAILVQPILWLGYLVDWLFTGGSVRRKMNHDKEVQEDLAKAIDIFINKGC